MKKSALIFCCLLLSVPIYAHAALNAGVVSGVWFSNPTPTVGESVHIFTAVQNQSKQTLKGTVAFLINGTIVGSTPFTVTHDTIIAVSIPYTFIGGEHTVSAYITSVQKNSVVYTTVAKTSISVAQKNTPAEIKTKFPDTTSTITKTTKEAQKILKTSEVSLARVAPIAEAAAHQIEKLRDNLITQASSTQTNKTNTEKENTATDSSLSFTQAKASATKLSDDTNNIFTKKGLAVWKKAVGVTLTLIAFLIRIWYVLFLLIFIVIFWRLVRGKRIR